MPHRPPGRSIRTQLAVLVLVPVLAVAFLAAVVLLDEIRLLRERSSLVRSVAVVSAMADVVHHLQAERGTSNTYRQTEGAQMADTLPGLRAETDQAFEAAELSIEQADLAEDVEATLFAVLDRRSEVDELRSQIDAMTIAPSDVVPTFTSVIHQVLDSAGPVVQATSDGTVARDLMGAVQVAYAKETAGLQRAQLASVFAADQFAPGQTTQIAGLAAERAAYLQGFQVAGGEQASAQLAELEGTDAAQEVQAMTQRALEMGSDFGQDPQEWFATATAFVDGLRDIEQDGYAEVAAATSDALRSVQLQFAGIAVLFAAGVIASWFIARRTITSVTGDVAAVDATLAEVREGHLDARAAVHGTAEIARMAGSLNTALDSVESAMARISQASGRLRTSAGELGTVATDLSSAAASSSSQVIEASRATEGVAARLGAISSSGDELREAIVEISRSTSEVQRIVEDAVQYSTSAVQTLTELSESSTRIGQVLKTVGDISEQTNLLALNATIEAARAGEAGKGFAVVASEVKELARATTEATEDIAERIEVLRQDTAAATSSIEQVTATIARIEGLQATIAAAVEQQTATTAGIVDNVVDSARSSEDITRRMVSVSTAAAATDASADSARTSAHALVAVSQELDDVVAKFRLTAR